MILKTFSITLSCLLFTSTLSTQTVRALNGDSLRTEVILIGTIHDLHKSNPNYSTQELKHILLGLKPDVLLIEIPADQMGQDGRVREEDRVGPELTTADEVASQLHIPQIPFDHPKRNEKNTQVFQRWQAMQPSFVRLDKDIKSRKNSTDAQFMHLYDLARLDYSLANPVIINSDAHDVVLSIRYLLNQDLLLAISESYPGYDSLEAVIRLARDWWNERNSVMVQNIAKAARLYPGKRLVVQTGSDHRYILRDMLKKQEGIVLKEYWEVLGN